MRVWTMRTPAGWVGAARTANGLAALTLPVPSVEESIKHLAGLGVAGGYVMSPPGAGDELAGLEEALNRYYNGERTEFEFPVDWSVYSPFQQKVLQVVRGIGYGSLLSYGQVAALAGYPRAVRAVGGALGSNRMLLVIPCHRVIRGDGSLGGFGGRPEWKRRLLATEGLVPGPDGRYPLCGI